MVSYRLTQILLKYPVFGAKCKITVENDDDSIMVEIKNEKDILILSKDPKKSYEPKNIQKALKIAMDRISEHQYGFNIDE